MKTILKLTAALVVLVMIGGVVTLRSAIKDVRAEQQELLKPGADAAASAESKDASTPSAEAEEVRRLREANKDLLKLRNEVRQLRRQADEMAKLRADNERLKNAPKPGVRQYPPDYIRRAALMDAGQATPEATIQTFMWAITQGNVDRFKDCLTPGAAAQMGKQVEAELQQGGVKAIPGFRITDKQENSPNEVVVKVEMILELEGSDRTIKLVRVGNDWKMEGF